VRPAFLFARRRRRKERVMKGCNTCDPSSAGMLFHEAARTRMKQVVDRRPEFDSSSRELVTLLGEVSRGDRGAFAHLYRRTSGKLYGICLRLLGSEADAQDVLQEVFVLVWQKAGRFDDGKASAITWLATLTRNRAIDRLRKRTIGSDGIEAAADVEDDSPSAFDVVGNAQDSARLANCLGELDERARTVIRAAFLDGATYPELAEREKVPLGTMKSWIRRGLQRLRGCLER
jgi:RNA polymerase sigma-70 factor (ECF subfamily)